MAFAFTYAVAPVLLFAILLASSFVQNSEAAFSGENGKIVFSQHDADYTLFNYDIYIVGSDGSGEKNLTPNTSNAIDREPALSPQGNKIAFASDRNGISDDIYVMNIDGSGLVNISNSPERSEISPSWSPDGSRIAVQSEDGIYTMKTDGSEVTYIADGWAPDWSPDGTRIAFIADRDGDDGWDVYIANSDGRGETINLTQDIAIETGVSWSPDGTKVAFTSNREYVGRQDGSYWTSNIFTLNSDGTGPVTRVTSLEPFCQNVYDPHFPGFGTDCISLVAQYPNWSPDGTKIAYSLLTPPAPPVGIVIANIDGSNERTIHTEALLGIDWGTLDKIPPRVTSVSDDPDPFSPNGDGVKDTSTITFNSNEAGAGFYLYLRPETLADPDDTDHSAVLYVSPLLEGANSVTLSRETLVKWSPYGNDEEFDVPLGNILLDGVYVYVIHASDFERNSIGYQGEITVDRTAPSVSPPPNVTVEATGQLTSITADQIGSATAIDAIDPAPTITNDAPATLTFPLGPTIITWTATDFVGNSRTAAQTVTVVDTTYPTLSVPSALVAEATGSAGAAVSFLASATDSVDGQITPSCDYTSGQTFSIGTTTITCTATDSSGNTSPPQSFTVKVQDTTAPTLVLPANIAGVSPTSPQGAAVTYTVSATDIVDANPTVTCTPVSGSIFAHSTTTTVTCTATDDYGNSSFGSFTVTVKSPAQAVGGIVGSIQDMSLPKGAENSLLAPLKNVANNLNDGNPNNDGAACGQLDAFINEVNAKEKNKTITAEQAVSLRTEAANLKATLGC